MKSIVFMCPIGFSCFLAGDPRVNEQLGLTTMHTVWLRQHNRVASDLQQLNPHWSGEQLYHETRRIIIAQLQHITYSHWLPIVIGTDILVSRPGYNHSIDATVANVFAAAAFRFGHALVPSTLTRLNSSYLPIKEGEVNVCLTLSLAAIISIFQNMLYAVNANTYLII